MAGFSEHIKFTDSKGRTWHPIAKTKHIMDLERRRGVAFFPMALKLAGALSQAKDNDEQLHVIYDNASVLFGGIEDTVTFLYECLRDSSGRVTYQGQEVYYDNFLDAVDGANMHEVMICAAFCVIAYFPNVKNDTASEDDAAPFGEGK